MIFGFEVDINDAVVSSENPSSDGEEGTSASEGQTRREKPRREGKKRRVEPVQNGKVVDDPSFAKGEWGVRWIG